MVDDIDFLRKHVQEEASTQHVGSYWEGGEIQSKSEMCNYHCTYDLWRLLIYLNRILRTIYEKSLIVRLIFHFCSYLLLISLFISFCKGMKKKNIHAAGFFFLNKYLLWMHSQKQEFSKVLFPSNEARSPIIWMLSVEANCCLLIITYQSLSSPCKKEKLKNPVDSVKILCPHNQFSVTFHFL